MISTSKQRANFYFRKEQEARLLIRERNEDLRATAEHIVAQRAARYPKGMRRHAHLYVEDLYRDMCDEDLTRKKLIENQQLFLRLAQAYSVRAQQERQVMTV